LGFLRLTAWLVALVLVLGIAVNLLQYLLPPPQEQSPWGSARLGVPAYGEGLTCPEDCPGCGVYVVRLYPRLVVDYYGLSVEGGRVVPKYTNTTVEAFRALSELLEPTAYYYYYSILTALVAFSTGREGAVYALRPLPLSEDDAENLTGIAIYVCGSPAPVYVPSVRPALLANSSVEIGRGYLYFPGLGFWAEVPVVRNVVTYAPTGSVSFEVSKRVVGEVLVEGFAEVGYSAELVGLPLCYSTTYYRVVGNTTYAVVEEHYCARYRVGYSYALGVSYSGYSEVTDEGSGVATYEVSPWTSRARVVEVEGGYFRGFGPFALAGIYAEHYSEAYCVEEVNGTCVRYSVDHYAAFRSEASTRSATFRGVAVTVRATVGEVWTGVLSTMEAYLRNSTYHAMVRPPNASVSETAAAYPWEEVAGRLEVWLVDRPAICGGYADPLEGALRVSCMNVSRYVRVASASVRLTKPRLGIWGWGTTTVVEPNLTISTWSAEKPGIDLEELERLLAPNPGEVWLQELTLRYLHDRLREVVGSTAMSYYPDAYLWLLVAQIPVAIQPSDCHGGAKPLYDALVEGRGCELERCELLVRVLNYSVPAWVEEVGLLYPSYSGTAVRAYLAVALVGGYPQLWELYDVERDPRYAKPAGGGYLLCYNTYENSVFCDWRRVRS